MSPLHPRTPPRNAASLVLYKRRAGQIYVLMGKRAKGHKFLPNVFVFPGGGVDKADFNTPIKAPLPPDIARQLSVPGHMAQAIATAAIRETFEETGLVIGDTSGGQLIPDLSQLDYIARAITPTAAPIRFNTRFLMLDAAHASGTLAGSGELLNLHWFPLQEARTMPLVDVTDFVLEVVEQHLNNPEQRKDTFPLFTYINGKPNIRWTA